MRAPTGLALILAALAGCSEDPAREAVAASFADPDSAKFQRIGERPDHVCGEVNGRGKDGVYAGYRRFIYDKTARRALVDTGEAELPPASAAGDDLACAKPAAYQSVDERFTCAPAEVKRNESNYPRFDELWREVCG